MPVSRQRLYAVLAVAHAFMLACFFLDRASGTSSAVGALPLDDAWIHLVYARSLAHGDGFAYNPGQLETGFTSPLWVVMLAPLFWIASGAALVVAVKLVGVALALAGSVIAFRLVERLTGNVASAWAAALLYTIDPALGFARLSGMEVILSTVIVLWTLRMLAEERPVRAALGCALAMMARPELAVFVAIAAPLVAWQLRRESLRARLLAILPIVILPSLWGIYCYAVTGHPLPATFYAKHQHHGLAAFADLPVLGRMILDLPWFAYGSGVVLFALGARRLMRSPVGVVIVTAAIALPLATAWTHKLVDHWPFYWARYFMPAIPLLYLSVGVAIGEGLALVRARRFVAAVPIVAVTAVGCLVWPGRLRTVADRYSNNCQNIQDLNVGMGEWVAAHAAPDDEVAAIDAGAIRFFGGRRVIDLIGLNDHQLLFGDRRDRLARARPTYYIVFPAWSPQSLADPRFELVHRIRVPVYTICNCPQDEMVVLQRRR